MVAAKERAELAERLITESCLKQCIQATKLKIHADRGAAMTAKSITQLMAGLSITKSHGRPRISNDNSCSEAQFNPHCRWPQLKHRGHSQIRISMTRRSLLCLRLLPPRVVCP